ncbi:acyl-CoA desaturase [Stratiformator vulcanicus]|uniref:Fatty acid desaturase n=1 Tax=Stratiformator vulcanicus TaxID=2527980 RepID=A0A517R3T0_9PLAN|nr:acyl-CoA desaturase [Stratiformator vulcanicus]QDT38531.1 Fatty acid desaturase [Stratiformator vulcanicus]
MPTDLLEAPASVDAFIDTNDTLDTAVAEPKPEKSQKQLEREAVHDSFAPDRLKWSEVDWPITAWIVGMHAGALAAPFFFTWQALAAAVVLHWMTMSIGICLGYHRFLAHRSLKLRHPADWFVIFCGVISGEGTPLRWAATHRLHHQQSDQHGDPHAPNEGAWWAHILWMFLKRPQAEADMLLDHYAPELKDRKLLLMYEKTYVWWLIGTGVILYAIGGIPMVLWALCLRMVCGYHSTWFVNSATHLWGYRNYESRDESKNLWWVAIAAYGEGWHNNHHAHPSNARAGHKWWEFDPTYWVICGLKATGLAYDVKDKNPAHSH